jgi:hypothetical protein
MVREHQRRLAVRGCGGNVVAGATVDGRREDRVRFWEAIGRGLSSEDAAAEAGVASACTCSPGAGLTGTHVAIEGAQGLARPRSREETMPGA